MVEDLCVVAVSLGWGSCRVHKLNIPLLSKCCVCGLYIESLWLRVSHVLVLQPGFYYSFQPGFDYSFHGKVGAMFHSAAYANAFGTFHDLHVL